MTRINLSRVGPVAIVADLLASLAVGAPSYNAYNVVPRSVFLTLPETAPEPRIELTASQRPSGQWVMQIDVTDFQFTALCVSNADAVPVGHAHVVRDGVKVASAYHPVVDLGHLPSGRHRFTAILRGQDHRALLGKNGLLRADLVIEVS